MQSHLTPSAHHYKRHHSPVFNLENLSILIIDDFSEMRNTCRRMLMEYDPQAVDDCGNGNDALEKMRRKKYDIVLCDYNLSESKDGQQILEEARHEGILDFSSLFMIITGENTRAMVMAAVEYEPDDYLTKPFTKEVLVKRLQRLIYRKQGFNLIGEALAEKNYHKAIMLCDALSEKYPKNTISLLKVKGNILYQAEEYSKATVLYQSMLEQHSLPWAHMGLGKIHFECQEYQKAKKIFSALLKESPNQMDAYDWLARTLQALGENDQAQSILQKASDLSPNVLVRRQRLADIAIANGDTAVAERTYKAAVKLSQGSTFKRAEDFTNLAKILVEQKRDQKAMQCLKRGRENFAQQTSALLQLAVSESEVHHAVNREKLADESLKKAKNLFKRKGEDEEISTTASLSVAEACLRHGDSEMGMEVILEVVGNNHENEELIGRVRQAFDQAGLAEEGERMMQNTITRIANINNEAAKLANQGKLDEAIELFVNAAKKLPANKVVNLNAAQALILNIQKNGGDDESLQQCKKYLDNAKKQDATDKRYQKLLKKFNLLEKKYAQPS